MKEIIVKYFKQQPLTDNEIIEFIDWYLKNIEQIIPSSNELQGILLFIKQGIFNIDEPMKRVSHHFKDIQVNTLYGKDGRLLIRNIHENLATTE